ncbi:MAG: hypothetical protein U5N86_06255 [Planctomycetota bacterium]|nr:hypothetical protein [Planctomycetota bacterium]
MPSNIEDSDKQQTGQATKDESPAPSVEGESTVAPPEPSSEDRKSEQEPASVEETAEFIKRMSEEYSNSEFSTVRYISFVVSNTFKGLALGFICDSYLFGKEYFIYVFQVIYNVYNGVLGRAAFDIENPPSAGIFIDNITNPELLFIGVLILFSCLAFGMWDGWREDRIREYAIRDNKRAKKILETSRKLAHINKHLQTGAV